MGDQLEAYVAAVGFEIFRADLDTALAYADGRKGGRPPYDPVLMFKTLIIEAQNNLSDDRAEFLIGDRLSFMRFLGLGLQDKVPDAKTIWAFRERLTRARAIDALFARFETALRDAGYIAMSGQLVDSTLVAAPKQRNTDKEKKDIKAGKTAAGIWPSEPAKARQKDIDARWTASSSARRRRPWTAVPRRPTSQFRLSGTRTTQASTKRSASSAVGMSQMPPAMTGECCARDCWTKPTLALASGPIARTVRSRTKRSWRATVLSAMSTIANPRAG